MLYSFYNYEIVIYTDGEGRFVLLERERNVHTVLKEIFDKKENEE